MIVIRNYGYPILPGATALWQAKNYDGGHKWLDEIGSANFQFGSATPSAYIGKANYTSETALVLPGTSGNYASTPDTAALDITGDITLVAHIAPADWTPSAINIIISKTFTAGQYSYFMYLNTDGTIRLSWFSNGTGATQVTISSTVATGFTDGTARFVAASLDANNGSSQNVVKFWTSVDGVTWSQLGSTVTTAGVATIFSSTSPLEIGAYVGGTGSPFSGSLYRAQVYDGVRDFSGTPSGGTLVFDADFSAQTAGTTSFTEDTGKTVTVNRSTTGVDTNDPLFLPHSTSLNPFGAGVDYVYLPGLADNYIDGPSVVGYAGSSTIVACVAPTDWTPGTEMVLGPLGGGAAGPFASITTDGKMKLWNQGSGSTTVVSDNVISAANGTYRWLKWEYQSSDHRVQMFESADSPTTNPEDVTWVQNGANKTLAAVGTGGTSNLWGSYSTATLMFVGAVKGLWFYTGLLSGGSAALSMAFNPDGGTISSTQSTLTGTGDGLTWTFSRATTGRKLAVVNEDKFLLGTDDYFTTPDNANLDFGASQDFTIVAMLRHYQPANSSQYVIYSKRDQNLDTAGYKGFVQGSSAGSNQFGALVEVGNVSAIAGASGLANAGTHQSHIFVRDGTDLTLYNNGTSVATATEGGDTSNARALLLGADLSNGSLTGYYDGEICAFVIFRRALAAAEVAQVVSELST